MSRTPYYRWYPSDYLADTLLFSDTEDLVYRRLLDYQWLEGAIPDAPADLARAARVSPATLKRVWPRVGKKFPAGEDGRRRNGRMERERNAMVEASQRRAVAGRHGASRRWPREGNATDGDQLNPVTGDGNAIALPSDRDSNVTPGPSTRRWQKDGYPDPDPDPEEKSIIIRAGEASPDGTRPPPDARAGQPRVSTPGQTAREPVPLPPRVAEALAELTAACPDQADVIRRVVSHTRDPDALIAECRMQLAGAHLPAGLQATWPVIGQALADIAVSGEPVTSRRLRVFVASLLRGDTTRERPPARGTPAQPLDPRDDWYGEISEVASA